MKYLAILLTVCCLFNSQTGFSAESSSAEKNQVCQEEGLGKAGEVFQGALEGAPALRDGERIYWDFITCTYSQAECRWEASYHGFYHWKAVHDHFHCGGGTHFACYGGHY